MTLFKGYTDITDFLHRFTLFKMGKWHVRLHRIKTADQTLLFHNHPFDYVSIILDGGYTERFFKEGEEIQSKTHRIGSIIHRTHDVFHRIDEIECETLTLFIAYGEYPWKALNPYPDATDDGVYQRVVRGKEVWAKRENGIWFIGSGDKEVAESEKRHSIHQK